MCRDYRDLLGWREARFGAIVHLVLLQRTQMARLLCGRSGQARAWGVAGETVVNANSGVGSGVRWVREVCERACKFLNWPWSAAGEGSEGDGGMERARKKEKAAWEETAEERGARARRFARVSEGMLRTTNAHWPWRPPSERCHTAACGTHELGRRY